MSDELGNLRERVAVNEQSTKAAHTRMDAFEKLMRDDIKDLRKDFNSEIKAVQDDMKIVLAFLERWKGMIAIITIGAGFFGWLIQQAIALVFHK